MRWIARFSLIPLLAAALEETDRAGLPSVRRASVDDARAIARMLHDFNREFDEPTPTIDRLEQRIVQLLQGADTVILLVGDDPHGLAVLRLREAIWNTNLECWLAELYVIPARRGNGHGRALMEAALREARDRGADSMEIGVDEPDHVARHLYESLGFTNRSGGANGPLTYLYERDLRT